MTEKTELMLRVKQIVEEMKSDEFDENIFLDEQRALSKKAIAFFKGIINNPSETESNRAFAKDAIVKEHAFLEVYAQRRITDYRILDMAEDIAQAVTLLTNEIAALKKEEKGNAAI